MTITWSLVIILGYDTIDWNRWFKKFKLARQWILKKDTSHSFNFQRASEILGFSDVCHLRCFRIHLFINHAFQHQKKHPGWRSVQGNGASAKSKAIEICITGWWLTYPSEKYESQLGVLCPIYGKIKAKFQTTNQIISVGKPGLGSPKSDEFNSTTLLLLFCPASWQLLDGIRLIQVTHSSPTSCQICLSHDNTMFRQSNMTIGTPLQIYKWKFTAGKANYSGLMWITCCCNHIFHPWKWKKYMIYHYDIRQYYILYILYILF